MQKCIFCLLEIQYEKKDTICIVMKAVTKDNEMEIFLI